MPSSRKHIVQRRIANGLSANCYVAILFALPFIVAAILWMYSCLAVKRYTSFNEEIDHAAKKDGNPSLPEHEWIRDTTNELSLSDGKLTWNREHWELSGYDRAHIGVEFHNDASGRSEPTILPETWKLQDPPEINKPDISMLGFQYLHFFRIYPLLRSHVYIAVPLGWISLICVPGMLPLIRMLRAKHRERAMKQQNQCRICSYDLRASSDKCPECGTAVPRPSGGTSPPNPGTA